jgi:hypothetical protein
MTQTTTSTFTRTHALYIASKVAADLRQMQIFYGRPTDDQIRAYADELVEHLVAGYLDTVEYGFKRDGAWVISLRYQVRVDGTVTDTGSGRVYAHADVSGLGFSSYLIKKQAFWSLTEVERRAFLAKLPFQREGADEPQHLNGYWDTGKSYAAGGVGAVRQQWRPV